MIKRYLFLCILFFVLIQVTPAQKRAKKVAFAYEQPCLVINNQQEHPASPCDLMYPLVFENDSLFHVVRFVEYGEYITALPDSALSLPIARIELMDTYEVVYLLDKNKKALAAVYPDEMHYEVQWLSNGKNSMLKQWEMVTFNMNIDTDESGENFYISYKEEVLIRCVDRKGSPEDFELTITYWDENLDGVIETKAITELSSSLKMK